MDISEAIRQRKSIRKFKPDLVSKAVLKEILEVASRSPSAMNTQPWEFFIVRGDTLEKIKQANVAKLQGGQMPSPEHTIIGWPTDSVYRRRQVELGMELFRLMNISRDDAVKRMQWMERGFRYFDAPAAIIIVTDKVLGEEGPLIGLGAIMQTICLAALQYGLGTCIEDQGVMYPDVIRGNLGIPEGKRIIMAIAIGYPDDTFPANKLQSRRDPVDSFTTWLGFEE
jgi:nitroreductase